MSSSVAMQEERERFWQRAAYEFEQADCGRSDQKKRLGTGAGLGTGQLAAGSSRL